MNEQKIIEILSGWLDNRKFPFRVPNAFIYSWECDLWVLSSDSETREFEIKISRQDFLKDAKKPKHTKDGANYFYYVCPENLIKKEEVPDRYGLIYVNDEFQTLNNLSIIKKPRKLHHNKFDKWQMLTLKMYFKWYELWLKKYQHKEITRTEYMEGFNLDILETEKQ